MIKVAYICHFSTKEVRERLHLRSFRLGNFMRRVAHIPPVSFVDFATWDDDFINALANNGGFECHVVSYHLGMKKRNQYFQLNRIKYYFIREREYYLKKI